jgi:hypothetical protein
LPEEEIAFSYIEEWNQNICTSPGVNFTNIIRAAFAPIFLRQKSTNLKSKYKKFCAKHSYKKAARKMLMKLTTVLTKEKVEGGRPQMTSR